MILKVVFCKKWIPTRPWTYGNGPCSNRPLQFQVKEKWLLQTKKHDPLHALQLHVQHFCWRCAKCPWVQGSVVYNDGQCFACLVENRQIAQATTTRLGPAWFPARGCVSWDRKCFILSKAVSTIRLVFVRNRSLKASIALGPASVCASSSLTSFIARWTSKTKRWSSRSTRRSLCHVCGEPPSTNCATEGSYRLPAPNRQIYAGSTLFFKSLSEPILLSLALLAGFWFLLARLCETCPRPQFPNEICRRRSTSISFLIASRTTANWRVANGRSGRTLSPRWPLQFNAVCQIRRTNRLPMRSGWHFAENVVSILVRSYVFLSRCRCRLPCFSLLRPTRRRHSMRSRRLNT